LYRKLGNVSQAFNEVFLRRPSKINDGGEKEDLDIVKSKKEIALSR